VAVPGSANDSESVTVSLSVLPPGTEILTLNYPDRSSLAADGWDFLARTASGIIRDTEQISGAVVSYSESGIQVPADVGDLWEGSNTTRNSLFRDLPQNWTSVCAAVSFAP